MHHLLPSLCAWLRLVCLACLTAALFAHPASANPKYAGLVIDANTGKELYAENADAKRHPASLTKIMTVYIIFEELAAQRLSLTTKMRVSKYAAGRPPSKIGFKPGDTITVGNAIKALVTKSANDVAVVVAEHIAKSETAFARRMTQTARKLAMTSTLFTNANGLPDPKQVTSARDMAKLGLAIQRDFPQYYGVFQTRVFTYGKRSFRNHNKLLGTVTGVDGIKTGYIRASGFNLVTSVRRDGKHIIGVVMGGRTGARRNAHMKDLIARTLPKAVKGTSGVPLVAFNDRAPAPFPRIKPAIGQVLTARLTTKDAAEDDKLGSQILAFAADARAPATNGPAADGTTDTLRAVISDAGLTPPPPVGASTETAEAIAIASTTPAAIAIIKSAERPLTSADGARDARFDVAFATLAQAPQGTSSLEGLIDAIARARTTAAVPLADGAAPSAMTATQARTNAASAGANADSPAEKRDPMQIIFGNPEEAADATAPNAGRRASATQGQHAWQIQVGAVGTKREAADLLAASARKVPEMEDRRRVTVPVATSDGTLYRARFADFASKQDAHEACKRFANHNRPCWAVSM